MAKEQKEEIVTAINLEESDKRIKNKKKQIAIATGFKELDEQLQIALSKNNEVTIVHYREFLEKKHFDLVILSKKLKGTDLSAEKLMFILKQNNTRIIYLGNSEDSDEGKYVNLCSKYAIYDILLSPFTIDEILQTIRVPKRFKDVSPYFVKYVNNEEIPNESLKELLKPSQTTSYTDMPSGNDVEKTQVTEPKVQKVTEIVEKVVQVPGPVRTVFIEKVEENDVIESSVITVFSRASKGCSLIANILSESFSKREYKTSLVNLDENNSANFYFDIDCDSYKHQIDSLVESKDFNAVIENSYKLPNLNIVTGKTFETTDMEVKDFESVLTNVKTNSDITIIDVCQFDMLKKAIANSSINIMVFDTSPFNFEINKNFLIELIKGKILNPEKTLIIINSANESKSYEYIRKKIIALDYDFRDVLPLNESIVFDDLILAGEGFYNNEHLDEETCEQIEIILSTLKSKKEPDYKFSEKVYKSSNQIIKHSKNILTYIAQNEGFVKCGKILIVLAILLYLCNVLKIQDIFLDVLKNTFN